MNVYKLVLCGIVCTISTLITMTTSAPSNDYYELLGVSRTAGTKDIKRAYRRMAAKYHPDKNKDDPEANDKFIRLSKIHEVLTDPEKRDLYDRFGEAGLDPNRQPPQPRPTHFQPDHFHFDFADMFHEEPRQEDFEFKFADFFDDVRSNHHDNNQRFYFGGFDEEDLFVQQRPQHRRPDNGGGRQCRTITKKIGNMIMTHTECT